MANNNKPSQKNRVISLLNRGYRLSSTQIATRLGTSPNRARFVISDLRNDGFNIQTDPKTNKYSLSGSLSY